MMVFKPYEKSTERSECTSRFRCELLKNRNGFCSTQVVIQTGADDINLKVDIGSDNEVTVLWQG